LYWLIQRSITVLVSLARREYQRTRILFDRLEPGILQRDRQAKAGNCERWSIFKMPLATMAMESLQSAKEEDPSPHRPGSVDQCTGAAAETAKSGVAGCG